MRFFLKLAKKENLLPLLIVIFFAVLAGRTLIFEKGYFNMHDDLQMMRQLEMEKCFKDWQIPCRWVPDMGYGYGFPLFNFYPPLPYLVGQIFRLVQFSFVDTAKLVFALSFILSGITMYFFSKEFFGKWGGTVSSIFYIWAPYHSVDVYVRGAMNEAWALIWFPAILLFSYKLLAAGSKPDKAKAGNVIYLALSWTGLLLSHNLMVMIFTPVFAVWCLIFWIKERNVRKVIQLFISGASAFSLAAFFTLPAVVEQKYVHVDMLTQGYYEYIAHYATIGQLLFSRFWGYGASIWGPNDGMSFQIGHIHWILSLAILVLVVFFFLKKKKPTIPLTVVVFSILFGWFAAFMAHQNSTFIWQRIRFLAFVQFPWRFLALVILAFSFIAGSLFVLVPKKIATFLSIALVITLVALDWNYFLPQGGKMGTLTDTQKFSGAAWDLQRTAGIFDYLPETAKQNPKFPPSTLAEIMKGKGSVTSASQGTKWARFKVDLTTDSTVRVNIYQFPVWKIFLDGKGIQSYIPESEVWGRIYVDIPKGQHSIDLNFTNTPIRTFSNYLSLLAWISLIIFLIWNRKKIHGKVA